MEEHTNPAAGATDWKKEALDWLKALVVAGALVIVVRMFLFSPFIVEGPSMEPNFHTAQRIIVNKLIYDLREPRRGEVVVFHTRDGVDYIKRVIALPGETVEVKGDVVLVNGVPIAEPYIQEKVEAAKARGVTYNNKNFGESRVPERHLFVMGDNRSNSLDSRDIGFIPYERIVGRADLTIWPLSEIGLIHH